MKTLLRVSFLATVAASVFGATMAFGGGGHFPNADTAFGLKDAGGAPAVESDRYCGTYYDSFRLIGNTAQSGGYHDPYKMIGGLAEPSKTRNDEPIAGQARIACSTPATERAADKPL